MLDGGDSFLILIQKSGSFNGHILSFNGLINGLVNRKWSYYLLWEKNRFVEIHKQYELDNSHNKLHILYIIAVTLAVLNWNYCTGNRILIWVRIGYGKYV